MPSRWSVLFAGNPQCLPLAVSGSRLRSCGALRVAVKPHRFLRYRSRLGEIHEHIRRVSRRRKTGPEALRETSRKRRSNRKRGKYAE